MDKIKIKAAQNGFILEYEDPAVVEENANSKSGWKDPETNKVYTDPKALPEIGDAQAAWDLYHRVWRPGKPHRQTWDDLYRIAVRVVTE